MQITFLHHLFKEFVNFSLTVVHVKAFMKCSAKACKGDRHIQVSKFNKLGLNTHNKLDENLPLLVCPVYSCKSGS